MKCEFTAVFRKVPEGYVGYVEELPGANTQGATLDEARGAGIGQRETLGSISHVTKLSLLVCLLLCPVLTT